MGVQITNILVSKEIKIDDLKGKTLAVDAFNVLYMFVTTIRGPDGSPLMDSKGRITSHLTGLFSRFSNLLEKGIKFVFVFDGTPPLLKSKERERRKSLKDEAKELYEEALQKQNIEDMKKYAARTTFLTKEMVEEAKQLIDAMGIPIIQAPSEGEAQAARLVQKGDAYAVMSQDADSLLSGSPRMIKNLSISGRKKMSGTLGYKTVEPELINLNENLSSLEFTHQQLICLAILVGTDYNYGGIKGIGPKKAINLLKKHGENFEKIFEEAKWSESFDFSWKQIFEIFKDMPIIDDYVLEFKDPDFEKIKKLLVEEHDFSAERVENTIKKLEEYKRSNAQKGLQDFF